MVLYTHKSIHEIRTFTALLFDGLMRTAFSRNPIVKGTVVQKHLDSSLIAKQLSKYIAKNSPVGNTVLMEDWPNNITLPFPSHPFTIFLNMTMGICLIHTTGIVTLKLAYIAQHSLL